MKNFVTTTIKLPALAASLLVMCAQPGQAQIVPMTDKVTVQTDTVAKPDIEASAANNEPVFKDVLALGGVAPASTILPSVVAAPAWSDAEERQAMMQEPYDFFKPPHLASIRFLENYVSARWRQSHTWTKTRTPTTIALGGGRTARIGLPARTYAYNGRRLGLVIGGPVNRNTWFLWHYEPITYGSRGILVNHTLVMQGGFIYGNSERFVRIAGGKQPFIEGFSDMGGLFFTPNQRPAMFTANNGFNADTGKGMQLSYNAGHLTTGKVYFSFQDKTESNANEIALVTPYDYATLPSQAALIYKSPVLRTTASGVRLRNLVSQGGRGIGFAFEKVIGTSGLSGVNVHYALNWRPGYLAAVPLTVGTGASRHVQLFPYGGKNMSRDQNLFIVLNKTFQDRNGFERFELSGGAGTWHNGRIVTGSSVRNGGYPFNAATINGVARFRGIDTSPNGYWGYGYYLQMCFYPIKSLLATYVQFNQYRAANHQNSVAGVNMDPVYYPWFATTAGAPFTFAGRDSNGVTRTLSATAQNTQWSVKVGTSTVVPGPLRSCGRIAFDYTYTGSHGTYPTHRWLIRWDGSTIW